MRSVNKVIIIGNLTRNPEMRQTPNGQNVTTFGLATNRQWVTKEGEKKNSAEFHECVAWARLAEICAQYIKKGNLIYVEGYLKTRSWDSPEGIKKFKTEIVVQDMIILEKRKNGESEEAPTYVPDEDDYQSIETLEAQEAAPAGDFAPAQDSDSTQDFDSARDQNSGENPIEKDLGL